MSSDRGIEVDVQNAVDPDEADGARLPSSPRIRTWVRGVLEHAQRPGELTVRMVGEAEGRTLNERYRHKAGPTNVLSFPCGAPDHPLSPPLLGDIVICAPVVAAEAQAQGKALEAHWAHLVVHGVLHLLGYDHQTETQARVMESLETELVQRMGYPDPYADAASIASVIG